MFKYLYIYMGVYMTLLSAGRHVKKNVKKVLRG